MPEVTPNGTFVHLHVHSEFSLLDGLSRIPELTQQAAAHGMPALALTDHGSLYGAVPFYQAATKAGVKPIIGVETYIAPRRYTDKEAKVDANPYHMILLAKNAVGYRNLLALVTEAHLNGYYYKPRIDKELLARHSEGLIGTSACLGGEVLKRLSEGDERAAKQAADDYLQILGRDNFYIEVQDHGFDDQRRVHPQLVDLARSLNLPLLATNDTHYTHKHQADAHDLLLCIQTGNNLDTPGRMRFDTQESYLKSAEEMARLFNGELPEALANTLRVAEQVDLKLTFDELRLPHFPVPERETSASWLRRECERGLADRYEPVTDEHRHRLDYELGIIETMGYSAYFLIVADFTRFARERGIMTTCRGSAPGSIVTYSLGITPVDPLQYHLPFERFLNPDRVTLPDIDIDFQDNRRDEVIEYVTRKYGDDRVAQIITFGTLGAKAAIRDVGRAMGLTYAEADRVAKAVPNELNISLDRAVETSPPLRELIATDERVDKLIGVAKQLEGVSRHASTHAAGIVISREPLTEIMPLQRATDGRTTMTQFEMHACEALGLLKFDFLGLINLTILADAVALIARTRGGPPIDLDAIPLDDAKTFELLATGETTGIFQLESGGMRRYVKELRPTSVLDLAAMVALFRPGPMANIPTYIRRKHGEEEVRYLHPSLEPALRETYGVFVYQEDIMTAAIAMADYTGPEADNLCYAIRKKKEKVLREHEVKFKTGAMRKGIPPQVVDDVFAAFEPFARYGFNKAHATCYGLLAYQTAYLKANYTVEFMTAVLNGFRDRSERVAAAIVECRRLGIEVLPPDVQRSEAAFTVETDADGRQAIRFGMLAIKNVGAGAIESIVAARNGSAETDGGPFRSLDDFCRRVDLHALNKRVVESLIKAQALGSLGRQGALLERLDTALESAARHQRDVAAGQGTLFDLFAAPAGADGQTSGVDFLDGGEEIPQRERLRWEKELLGLYLTEHPLREIETRLPEFVNAYSGDLAEESDQARVTVAGIIVAARRLITRAGAAMLVATVEDLQGTMEVVVFPKVLAETPTAWAEDGVVVITGRVDRRDDQPSVLCEVVHPWDEAVSMGAQGISDERERLGRGRGRGNGYQRPNGNGNGSGSGNGHAVPVGPGAPTETTPPVEVVSVMPRGAGTAVLEPGAVAASSVAAEPTPPIVAPEPTPAPPDAVPLAARASVVEGTILVSFPEESDPQRILGAVDSVNDALRARGGDSAVVLCIPVAGVPQQVRVPYRVAWDDELPGFLTQATGMPLDVRLTSGE